MDAELAKSVMSLFADITTPASLDRQEAIDKVESVRRLLNSGSTAAIDIQQVVIFGTDVGERLRDLEAENSELIARLLEVSVPQAVGGYYRIDQFMTRLAARRGHTYAIRIDYVTATQTTPGVRVVRDEDINVWQREGRVPDWAYGQIDQLIWPPRMRRQHQFWTTAELDALCEFYSEDPSRTNTMLAEMLTRFGRPFTEQQVRAQLDRQRRKNRVSQYRTPKAEAVISKVEAAKVEAFVPKVEAVKVRR